MTLRIRRNVSLPSRCDHLFDPRDGKLRIRRVLGVKSRHPDFRDGAGEFVRHHGAGKSGDDKV
ncbi:MAG: hypothetical protein JSR63_07075 [Proteobacteria bacterium]|nr:hypothetical protein [Pseudomonadota bacterium]MBS0217933.1 hypothetical protein [Pseudomonadota bacterium]